MLSCTVSPTPGGRWPGCTPCISVSPQPRGPAEPHREAGLAPLSRRHRPTLARSGPSPRDPPAAKQFLSPGAQPWPSRQGPACTSPCTWGRTISPQHWAPHRLPELWLNTDRGASASGLANSDRLAKVALSCAHGSTAWWGARASLGNDVKGTTGHRLLPRCTLAETESFLLEVQAHGPAWHLWPLCGGCPRGSQHLTCTCSAPCPS